MKIVIEIDEARYKDIQRIAAVQSERSHFQTAEQIIAKGVPIEQEPCDDAISRQAVLDALYDLFDVKNDRLVQIPWSASAIDARINALPSVQPNQKEE